MTPLVILLLFALFVYAVNAAGKHVQEHHPDPGRKLSDEPYGHGPQPGE